MNISHYLQMCYFFARWKKHINPVSTLNPRNGKLHQRRSEPPLRAALLSRQLQKGSGSFFPCSFPRKTHCNKWLGQGRQTMADSNLKAKHKCCLNSWVLPSLPTQSDTLLLLATTAATITDGCLWVSEGQKPVLSSAKRYSRELRHTLCLSRRF